MTKFASLFLAVALAASATACKNPADGKAKATVEEAKPEPTKPEPAKADPAAPAAAAVTYAIAPDTSKIEMTGSKPTKTHQLKVNAFSGTASVTDGKLETAQVKVEIDMKSIESDDAKLTGHLQSPDLFDTAKFPTATFTSTEIKAGGDKGATHTITGNLELHGEKKSITFPATAAVAADKLTLTAEFVINRKDFGIVYPGMPDDLIRDEVVIKLNIAAPVAGATGAGAPAAPAAPAPAAPAPAPTK